MNCINKIFALVAGLMCAYSVHALSELPIVVIVPSYNNKDWYQKNLDSIFSQKYENYRVIFIDDSSSDGTGQLVAEYVHQHNFEHKITLLQNSHRCWKAANIYRAIHLCCADELIIELDGDDWFAGDWVFRFISDLYQQEDIWFTYGGYTDVPGGTPNLTTPSVEAIAANRFRSIAGNVWAGGRTYYAWLAQKVEKKDFLDNEGNFLKFTADAALVFPMLEMAGHRFKRLETVFYIHNCLSPLNDHKVDVCSQGAVERLVRSRPAYSRIAKR